VSGSSRGYWHLPVGSVSYRSSAAFARFKTIPHVRLPAVIASFFLCGKVYAFAVVHAFCLKLHWELDLVTRMPEPVVTVVKTIFCSAVAVVVTMLFVLAILNKSSFGFGLKQ